MRVLGLKRVSVRDVRTGVWKGMQARLEREGSNPGIEVLEVLGLVTVRAAVSLHSSHLKHTKKLVGAYSTV